MKRVIFFFGLALMLGFISCKKEDKVIEKTTLEKVQAKWNLDNIVIHLKDAIQSIDTTVVLTGGADDYFEFKNDGNAYTMIDGESDISSYGLSGDSSIIHESFGTYQILQLTDNILKLYQKEVDGTFLYEETINLKK